MIKYYIPLYYTFITRYTTIISKISFFIMVFFPDLLYLGLLRGINLRDFYYYTVSFYSIYSIYECGYLFNDIITTKFENNATKRLTKLEEISLLKHFQGLITVRAIIVIMINSYLFYQYDNYKIFIIFQIILLAAYSIHNFFRNRINICTMCIMVTMKYFIPMSIFIDFFENIIAYFILFLSIPLIRTIEYAGKERYGLKWIQINNYDIFRIKYYLCLFLFLITIYSIKYINIIHIILPLGLLLFRAAAFFFLKSSTVASSIEKNRSKQSIKNN